jgi:type VI secretion system protein ImpK
MSNPDVQDAAVIREKAAVKQPRNSENLALLYQGLLTGIVRMQSRRQHVSDAETFRRRTKTALQEVERDAMAAGYDGQDIKDTHFAVVAFLDSVVLNSSEPIRAEWVRKTLQEELFGQTDAGEVFFVKLDGFRSRRDSQQLADILEVYLLCLLLGFEGRYSGGLRGELDVVAEKVRRRIDDIRGRVREISPMGGLPPAAPTATAGPERRKSYRVVAIGVLVAILILFLAFKLDLLSMASNVRIRL